MLSVGCRLWLLRAFNLLALALDLKFIRAVLLLYATRWPTRLQRFVDFGSFDQFLRNIDVLD